jgi:hypothetical protein
MAVGFVAKLQCVLAGAGALVLVAAAGPAQAQLVGFAVDRYGPATKMVAELHRQIEEVYGSKEPKRADGQFASV